MHMQLKAKNTVCSDGAMYSDNRWILYFLIHKLHEPKRERTLQLTANLYHCRIMHNFDPLQKLAFSAVQQTFKHRSSQCHYVVYIIY